jgi:peroxiredoxin
MRFLLTAFLFITVVSGQSIPRPATEFPITLATGQVISPTQFKGKVVAVELLLTTCPHCQQTARGITKLSKEYASKGLVVIGGAVNTDGNIPEFIKTTGATFPIGMVNREKVYGFLEQSLMRPNLMFPILVLIDKSGQVRAQFQGNDPFFKAEEANLRALLDKLTAEGVSKAPAIPAKKKAS